MSTTPATEAVLFGLLLFALSITSFFSRRHFLFGVGILLPWMVPQILTGVGIFWYKVLGPAACILGLVRGGKSPFRGSGVALFGWVIAYASVLSLIWMVLELNYLQRYRLAAAMEMGGGAAQHELKMPVQLVGFIAQVSILFVVPLCARTLRDTRAAVAGLITGSVLSVGVGLLHIVLFGSGTFNTPEASATLVLEGVSLNRVGGLSGEPKLLGSVLAVVVVYFFTRVVFASGRQSRREIYALLLALGGLFLTYSTSGWVAGGLGLVTATVLAMPRVRASRFAGLLILIGAGILVLSSIGVVAMSVESRIVERLFGESSDVGKQKDIYVFDAFSDQPLHTVFGFGLGGADLAVIPYVEWLHLQYKRTPTPGVTGVRMLGDLGVIGILLFAVVASYWARVLRTLDQGPAAVFMVAGLVVAMTSSTLALSVYLFLAGAMLASAHLARQTDALTVSVVPLRLVQTMERPA
jgi:hypothetical protein